MVITAHLRPAGMNIAAGARAAMAAPGVVGLIQHGNFRNFAAHGAIAAGAASNGNDGFSSAH